MSAPPAPPQRPETRRPETRPSETRRFETLEAGRALAAVAVAIHHAALMVAQPRHLGVSAFAGAPVFFNAGVDYFFVLSGFIIAFVHWDDLGRPEALGGYARARLTRIYPLYWAILLPLVAIYAAVPSFGVARQHDWGYVAGSFLLLPMPDQPVLGVAWSLTYELAFYLLFAGAIVGGRRCLWLGAVWAAGVVAWAGLGDGRFPLAFLLNPHDLQFLMGVAAAAWMRTRKVPAPRAWLAAGAAGLLFVAGWAEPRLGFTDPLWVALALGAASAACVLGAAEAERSGGLRAPRWLAGLGAASYAVYLIHVVAESFSIRLFLRAGLRQPELLVVALAVTGVAAGLACRRWVERPLLCLVRTHAGRAVPRRRAFAAAAPAGER